MFYRSFHIIIYIQCKQEAEWIVSGWLPGCRQCYEWGSETGLFLHRLLLNNVVFIKTMKVDTDHNSICIKVVIKVMKATLHEGLHIKKKIKCMSFPKIIVFLILAVVFSVAFFSNNYSPVTVWGDVLPQCTKRQSHFLLVVLVLVPQFKALCYLFLCDSNTSSPFLLQALPLQITEQLSDLCQSISFFSLGGMCSNFYGPH